LYDQAIVLHLDVTRRGGIMPALRRSDTQRSRDGASRGVLVAVHRGHLEVHKALDDLARSRLDLRLVSVVGTDYHTQENVYGYYTTGRRLEAWGSFGSFWSGVWGVLSGGGFFFVPGLGPVLIAGPLTGWLVAALDEGVMVHGLSPLGAALVGKGVSPEAMIEYETAVRCNEFLLVASGPLPPMTAARAVVERTGVRADVHER
jgi:hypothetical protein